MRVSLISKLNSIFYLLNFLVSVGLIYSCSDIKREAKRLPVLGERATIKKVHNGKIRTHTVFHQIPAFRFVNQNNQQVTDQTLAGKVYVSDFFFTSCPTICPKMKTQLLRVYEKFKDNDRVMFLSHTIDPQHDSVAVLRDYAQRLGISGSKWHFVTGSKDSIYAIAPHYLVSTSEDDKATKGLVHSGAFVLVDTNRHIRGIYDGTKPEKVDALLADIQILLAKKNHF
jgi:protein SCO1/2